MAEYAKRGYLLENFRLFHLRSESGEKVDFHYHEFCKLLFLVSGQGSYFVDGKRYLLSAGDLVLIGSRSVHKPELAEGSTYERIIIYISPDYLQRMSTQDCDLLSLFSGSHGHVLRLKEQRRKAVFSLVSKLERDLGFANGYIGQLRKGVFPSDRLMKIADYFSVPHLYLLNGETEAPTQTVEQDILDEIDVAFYGDYKALSEDDKETLRAMARLMRERRSNQK